MPIQGYSLGCTVDDVFSAEALLDEASPFDPSPQFAALIADHFPRPTLTPWISDLSSPFPETTSTTDS